MTRAQLEQALADNRQRAAEIKQDARPKEPVYLRIHIRDLEDQVEEAREELSRLEGELDIARDDLRAGKGNRRKLTPDEKAEADALRDERRRLHLALSGRGVVILEDAAQRADSDA